MVEIHLEGLGGRTVRYGDHTWELDGDVEVLRDGELLEVAAARADGVRHESGVLRFALEDPPGSLNPGSVGEYFEELVRDGDSYTLVVDHEGRSYEYDLTNYAYD